MTNPIVNLTSEPVTIRNAWGTITIPSSGILVRVVETYEEVPIASGGVHLTVCVVNLRVAGAEGILGDETIPVIVPKDVLPALAGRPNTYAPDTGRDSGIREDGHIVAVARLVR